MLQQTRVAAVIPYFERFLERFPDVTALAEADEDDVLALWSGLGYYSRARSLQKAAREIVARGGFPTDYESIRRLAGVGEYTAAAIASIAFGLPYAVLDGNALRVLARLANDDGDVRAGEVRRRLGELAGRLLDRNKPGEFNQALMELGATVCTPRDPACLTCPLSRYCEARQNGTERQLPVKLGRTRTARVEKTLLVVERHGAVLLRQRPAGSGQLVGFWELPELGDVPRAVVLAELGSFRHSITNTNFRFTVLEANVRRAPKGFEWVARDVMDRIPLTTAARKALASAKASRARCIPEETAEEGG
jgi:A/G-specific adenine glycosylase